MKREEPGLRPGGRQTWREVFRMPLLLALASALGLSSALFGDGIWDALSWAALAVPPGAAAWSIRLSARREQAGRRAG